ncbi:transmembrane protein, putative, partial [Bodo saltans]
TFSLNGAVTSVTTTATGATITVGTTGNVTSIQGNAAPSIYVYHMVGTVFNDGGATTVYAGGVVSGNLTEHGGTCTINSGGVVAAIVGFGQFLLAGSAASIIVSAQSAVTVSGSISGAIVVSAVSPSISGAIVVSSESSGTTITTSGYVENITSRASTAITAGGTVRTLAQSGGGSCTVLSGGLVGNVTGYGTFVVKGNVSNISTSAIGSSIIIVDTTGYVDFISGASTVTTVNVYHVVGSAVNAGGNTAVYAGGFVRATLTQNGGICNVSTGGTVDTLIGFGTFVLGGNIRTIATSPATEVAIISVLGTSILDSVTIGNNRSTIAVLAHAVIPIIEGVGSTMTIYGTVLDSTSTTGATTIFVGGGGVIQRHCVQGGSVAISNSGGKVISICGYGQFHITEGTVDALTTSGSCSSSVVVNYGAVLTSLVVNGSDSTTVRVMGHVGNITIGASVAGTVDIVVERGASCGPITRQSSNAYLVVAPMTMSFHLNASSSSISCINLGENALSVVSILLQNVVFVRETNKVGIDGQSTLLLLNSTASMFVSVVVVNSTFALPSAYSFLLMASAFYCPNMTASLFSVRINATGASVFQVAPTSVSSTSAVFSLRNSTIYLSDVGSMFTVSGTLGTTYLQSLSTNVTVVGCSSFDPIIRIVSTSTISLTIVQGLWTSTTSAVQLVGSVVSPIVTIDSMQFIVPASCTPAAPPRAVVEFRGVDDGSTSRSDSSVVNIVNALLVMTSSSVDFLPSSLLSTTEMTPLSFLLFNGTALSLLSSSVLIAACSSPQSYAGRMSAIEFVGANILNSKMEVQSMFTHGSSGDGRGEVSPSSRFSAITTNSSIGFINDSTLIARCFDVPSTSVSFMDLSCVLSNTSITIALVAIRQSSDSSTALLNVSHIMSRSNTVELLHSNIKVFAIISTPVGSEAFASAGGIRLVCSFVGVIPMSVGHLDPSLSSVVSTIHAPNCPTSKRSLLSSPVLLDEASPIPVSCWGTFTLSETVTGPTPTEDASRSASHNATHSVDSLSLSVTLSSTSSHSESLFTSTLGGTVSASPTPSVTPTRSRRTISRPSASPSTTSSQSPSNSSSPTLTFSLSQELSLTPTNSSTPQTETVVSPNMSVTLSCVAPETGFGEVLTSSADVSLRCDAAKYQLVGKLNMTANTADDVRSWLYPCIEMRASGGSRGQTTVYPSSLLSGDGPWVLVMPYALDASWVLHTPYVNSDNTIGDHSLLPSLPLVNVTQDDGDRLKETTIPPQWLTTRNISAIPASLVGDPNSYIWVNKSNLFSTTSGSLILWITVKPKYASTTSMTAVASCGGTHVPVEFSILWPQKVLSAAAQAIGGAVAVAGPFTGDPTAAAALAMVSLLSCSGSTPALSSFSYVVSVFFNLGATVMAIGNVGLIAAFCFLHYSATLLLLVWRRYRRRNAVLAWERVVAADEQKRKRRELRHSMSSADDATIDLSSSSSRVVVAMTMTKTTVVDMNETDEDLHLRTCGDARFPALTILAAGFLLPGSAYGASAAVSDVESSATDVALGVAAIIGLIATVVGMQWILYKKALPSMTFEPYPMPYRTGFPVERRLVFPAARWLPTRLRLAYQPLMGTRAAKYCKLSVVDLLLAVLLSVATGIGVGTNGASCSFLPIFIAICYLLYAGLLAALRPHRLPIDRVACPLIAAIYGIICMMKYFSPTSLEDTTDALQLALSVLQLWQVLCAAIVVAREFQWGWMERQEEKERLRLQRMKMRGDRKRSSRRGKGHHLDNMFLLNSEEGNMNDSFDLFDGIQSAIRKSPVESLHHHHHLVAVDDSQFWDSAGHAISSHSINNNSVAGRENYSFRATVGNEEDDDDDDVEHQALDNVFEHQPGGEDFDQTIAELLIEIGASETLMATKVTQGAGNDDDRNTNPARSFGDEKSNSKSKRQRVMSSLKSARSYLTSLMPLNIGKHGNDRRTESQPHVKGKI